MEALAEAKSKLKELLEDDNYTESEKTDIQAEVDRITALEKIIADEAKAVEELKQNVENLNPDTITSDDKEAVDGLIEEIEAKKSDSNLTEKQRTELEEAIEDAQEILNKIAEDQKSLAVGVILTLDFFIVMAIYQKACRKNWVAFDQPIRCFR